MTELVKTAQTELGKAYSRHRVNIQKILPARIDENRFMYLVKDQIDRNPALAGVTPASFLRCVLTATSLGLEIRQNSAYLLPFGQECQLLIDYRGKMDIARRSGKVGSIMPVLVRERDDFEWWIDEKGPHLKYVPFRGSVAERGEIVAGFAMANIIAGGSTHQQFLEPMDIAEIEAVRCRAHKGVPELSLAEIRALDATKLPFKDKRRTPWTTDYDAMAMKTLIHRLFKWLPQTEDMAMSDEVDAATDTGRPTPVPIALSDIEWTHEEETKPILERHDASEMEEIAQQKIAAMKATEEKLPGKVSADAFKASLAEAAPRRPPFVDYDAQRRATTAPQAEDQFQPQDLTDAGFVTNCAGILKAIEEACNTDAPYYEVMGKYGNPQKPPPDQQTRRAILTDLAAKFTAIQKSMAEPAPELGADGSKKLTPEDFMEGLSSGPEPEHPDGTPTPPRPRRLKL